VPEDNPRKLTLLDRAVALISPGTALNRVVDRARLHQFSSVYEAAARSARRGTSGGITANSASESWAANRDRIKLMWDARHAVRNIPFIHGYMQKERMYVCNNIEYHADTGIPEVDTVYQEWFYDWCSRADMTGRMRFAALVETLYGSFRTDGDSGFNIVRDDRSKEPRLQIIEADRIGSPYETVENDRYFAGVLVDEVGKPTAYRVFARTRTGQYVNPQEIPASRFVHLIRRSRTDEYRGVTPLACVLPKAKDLHEWMAITMAAGKSAAMWSAFVECLRPLRQTPA
jgi:capsid protein